MLVVSLYLFNFMCVLRVFVVGVPSGLLGVVEGVVACDGWLAVVNVVGLVAMALALPPRSEVVLGQEGLESFDLAVDLAVELLAPSELAQCWLLE